MNQADISITIQNEKFADAQAVTDGIFADEIIPVELRGVVISKDDTIRPGVTIEGLSALKPAFPNWGESTTTAGNASGVGDGAGVCILTTRSRAENEGMEIVGKYVTSAVVGQLLITAYLGSLFTRACVGVEPRYMGISPIYAVPKVLAQVGLSKDDVDVYEVRNCGSFNSVNDLCFADQRSLCVSVRLLC